MESVKINCIIYIIECALYQRKLSNNVAVNFFRLLFSQPVFNFGACITLRIVVKDVFCKSVVILWMYDRNVSLIS